MDLRGKNYYELFGVGRNASIEEIRRAKLRLIRQYSNERYPEEFMFINEAFDVLSDPVKRSQYDDAPDGRGSTYLEGELQQCYYYLEKEDYVRLEQLVKRLSLNHPFNPQILQLYTLALHHLGRYNEEKGMYEKLIRNENEIVTEGHLSLLIDYIASQQYVNEQYWMTSKVKQMLAHKAKQLKKTEYIYLRVEELYRQGNFVWPNVLWDFSDVLFEMSDNSTNHHYRQLASELRQEAERVNNQQNQHYDEKPSPYQEQYRPTRPDNDEYSIAGNIIFSILISMIFTPIVGIIAFGVIHYGQIPIWKNIVPVIKFIGVILIVIFIIMILFLLFFD